MKKNHLMKSAIGYAVVWALAIPASHAQFDTGFETTDGGYTVDGQLAGVQDDTAPTGNTWQNVTGFAGGTSVISSDEHPLTGALSLKLLDTSTGAGTAVSVDLAGGVNTSNPFTIQFSWAIASTGGSAGPVLNAWYGTIANSLSQPNWMHVNYDSSNDQFGIYLNNGSSSASQLLTLGTYASIANAGEYVTWTLAIDPTTHTYTSVTLTGSQGTIDATSIVQSTGGGVIPWRSGSMGEPADGLWFSSGGAGTVTAYVDDVSIIPEPATFAALAGCIGLLVVGFRRFRQ